MKWLKKNWFKVLIVIAFIIGLVALDRACQDAGYEKKIKESDEKIEALEADNTKKDEVIEESIKNAKAAEARVAESLVIIEERDVIIKDLKKKEGEVVEVVMALPPSRLVEDFREILECAEIQLTEQGILFPIECSRTVLVMIEQFSFKKERLDETTFSLSEALEAIHLQKLATWYIYRIAWAQGSQIMNYQSIIEEKDFQFDLCEKRKKKSFWSGLKIGFVLSVSITVTIVVVIPVIKKLI